MKSVAPAAKAASIEAGVVMPVAIMMGRGARAGRFAQPPADGDAVELRHLHVEDHEVGRSRRSLERGGAVGRLHTGTPLARARRA
jgi:hypothetical protein